MNPQVPIKCETKNNINFGSIIALQRPVTNQTHSHGKQITIPDHCRMLQWRMERENCTYAGFQVSYGTSYTRDFFLTGLELKNLQPNLVNRGGNNENKQLQRNESKTIA
ncbi:hypothetical protein M9H77_13131 [Catharanthus roseus]|uniref:Uncharacterized protein n=1 Tax=Catharanthus roseus TaxID=4058 RepID=A0ACC0BJP0_CATRO|nr:hypothetical protein M9H77_13131 [Catharanthus roseus]